MISWNPIVPGQLVPGYLLTRTIHKENKYASTYSSDLKLELITTGEKAGTWGTITNTNLQQLEQAASGYISHNIGAADLALDLSNGAVSNGKNLYFKLTGTLTANRTMTMPDGAEKFLCRRCNSKIFI